MTMRRPAALLVVLVLVGAAGAKRRHRGHLPIDVDPDNVNGGGGSVISGADMHGGAGGGDHGRSKKASGE